MIWSNVKNNLDDLTVLFWTKNIRNYLEFRHFLEGNFFIISHHKVLLIDRNAQLPS